METSGVPFIPSKGFLGQKNGYVFQMGVQGLGYYVDKFYNTSGGKRKSADDGGNSAKKQKIEGEGDIQELTENSLKVLLAHTTYSRNESIFVIAASYLMVWMQ